MRNFAQNKRGQFVIIAALLVALMMLSLGPLLHEAATYYTREPWDEYLSLIGGVELNTQRLVETSLADYTQTLNRTQEVSQDILGKNMELWRSDLNLIYQGRGIELGYALKNGTEMVCGSNIYFQSGLNYSWYGKTSNSSANAKLTLNMSSVGLKGYNYESTALLNLTILDVFQQSKTAIVAIGREGGVPADGLTANNFYITNSTTAILNPVLHAASSYNATYGLVYTLVCSESFAAHINVTAVDQRGIFVISTW